MINYTNTHVSRNVIQMNANVVIKRNISGSLQVSEHTQRI